MITFHQFQHIKSLQEQSQSAGQIAPQVGITEKTARLWMSREHYQFSCPAKPRPSKLDPHKDRIDELIAQFNGYTAQQIFQKLLEKDNYQGSYTLVKEYLRKIRPRKSRVYDHLIFAPGEVAQVDFGECGLTEVGNTRRKLYVFIMVLGYSRLMFVEFILRQNLECFLSCHRHAFEAIGGVPAAVMVDRTKCAILGNDRFGKPIPNSRYDDFRRYYGFSIRACAKRSPHQKGRVESGVGFVKINFMNGRPVEPFVQVGEAATLWCEQTANRRIHRTTNRRPIELYEEGEKSAMQPLPILPYDCSIVHNKRVDKQACFHFDGNRYSVPPQYAQGKITVHSLPERLAVYCDAILIARHLRCYEKRAEPIIDPEHKIQLNLRRKQSFDRKLVQRFLALGQVAQTYYQGLQQRSINERSHIRKLLALAEYHDRTSLLNALEDAASHHAFSAEYIANILQFRTHCKETSPLQLFRNKHLLDLNFNEPGMDPYERKIPSIPKENKDKNKE